MVALREEDGMITLEANSLVFRFPEVHQDAVLRISFKRTLRVPDDDQTYPWPARSDRRRLGVRRANLSIIRVIVGVRISDSRKNTILSMI